MKEIVLDFSGIDSRRAMHSYFIKAFDLPDYYGRNLDALWDCLRGSFAEETLIKLINLDDLPAEMTDTVDAVKELFYDLDAQERYLTVEVEESNDFLL